MDSPSGQALTFAEVEARAKAYNEAPLKPWQQAAIQEQQYEEAHPRPKPFEYTRQTDIERLGKNLAHFFEDGKCDEPTELLQSAKKQFLGAVELQDASPYAAFKKVISTTALAQQMDTHYASQGGIDYYIMNLLHVSYSDAFRVEGKQGIRRRKVEAIKSLMAKDKAEATSGSQATEALQATDGVAQGHESELEQSDLREKTEKMELGGNINDETQLSEGGVADSEEVKL